MPPLAGLSDVIAPQAAKAHTVSHDRIILLKEASAYFRTKDVSVGVVVAMRGQRGILQVTGTAFCRHSQPAFHADGSALFCTFA